MNKALLARVPEKWRGIVIALVGMALSAVGFALAAMRIHVFDAIVFFGGFAVCLVGFLVHLRVWVANAGARRRRRRWPGQ